MKACELHIIIEQSDKTFALGDTLNGVVVVDVTKTTQCDGLKISKFWRTHGRGDINQGSDSSETLFTGEWQPGHYEYPFEFELNEHKTSYHGEIVNLDWYLNASADVPWAFDPGAEEDFLLLTRHLAEDYHYRQRAQLEHRKRGKSSSPFTTLFPLVFFVIFAMFIFKDSAFIQKFFTPDLHDIASEKALASLLQNLFWFVPLLIGGFLLLTLLKYLSGKQVEKLLEDLRIVLPQNEYQPGDSINAVFGFTPLRNLPLEYCYAQLVAHEIAVDNSGTTSTTHKHEVYFDEITVDLPHHLLNQVPVSRELRFEIPENVPASFSTGENSIRWSLDIDLRLNRWLFWSHSNIIKIRHSV